jgi:hypothetical protein
LSFSLEQTLFTSWMVLSVQECSVIESSNLALVSVELEDSLLNVNESGVGDLGETVLSNSSESLFKLLFNFSERASIDLVFLFQCLGSFHSVGRVDKESVVLIGIHQRVDHIGGSLELSVLVMGSIFPGRHEDSSVTLSHFLHVVRVEVRKVVVHLWGVFVS